MKEVYDYLLFLVPHHDLIAGYKISVMYTLSALTSALERLINIEVLGYGSKDSQSGNLSFRAVTCAICCCRVCLTGLCTIFTHKETSLF